MKVETRGALDELAGRRRPQPVPAAKPEPAADPFAGLADATRQLVDAAQLLASAAQAPVKPKKLEAIVQRDKAGKMEKVIINVI